MIDDLDTILDNLKKGVDLVDVVSDTVTLRRAGRDRYVGICPFHAERDGSLSINRKKQLWFCFGCNVGGDVVTWVRELHGETFWGALRQLAGRIGMELPEPINRRRDPVPPLELVALPAAYRAEPYVLLVEQHASLENVSTPFARLREPVLTPREALRLERLHTRACLVYTDELAAMQSARNAFSACPILMLHLRPAPADATVREAVFREWPDELWRLSEPAINVLIHYELGRLGWTRGAASVLQLTTCGSLQKLLLKACREAFVRLDEPATPAAPSAQAYVPRVEEVGEAGGEVVEQLAGGDGVAAGGMRSPLWDDDAVVGTGLDERTLAVWTPGADGLEGVEDEARADGLTPSAPKLGVEELQVEAEVVADDDRRS